MWLLVIEPITWFMLTLGVNYFALPASYPCFITISWLFHIRETEISKLFSFITIAISWLFYLSELLVYIAFITQK